MADDDFALPFTTEPLPGSDPTIDWGEMIRASRNTLEARKATLETQCRPSHVTVPGHEIDIKRNKDGSINRESNIGSVAVLVLAAGGEAKAGESEFFSGDTVVAVNIKEEGRRTPRTIDYRIKPGQNKVYRWLDFALNGRRGCVTGSTIVYDDKEYTLDEMKEVVK